MDTMVTVVKEDSFSPSSGSSSSSSSVTRSSADEMGRHDR
jgi:hypothetical protein